EGVCGIRLRYEDGFRRRAVEAVGCSTRIRDRSGVFICRIILDSKLGLNDGGNSEGARARDTASQDVARVINSKECRILIRILVSDEVARRSRVCKSSAVESRYTITTLFKVESAVRSRGTNSKSTTRVIPEKF